MTASPSFDTVFTAAIELPAADRAAYIARACGPDSALRERVERLVAAHFRAGSFLDAPAPELAATVDQPPPDGPGTVVGPYRHMDQVGEGGLGVVFVAEQTHPVRRKVALKVIKPGMDTREVVARFEAERQALALMDHPNIARVLDAGVTDRGRPYFVMELVRGIPVTDYCDRAQLGVRDRLALFVQVCQAVQHAHQKGVIHRDLKPTNILVTEHDGTPVAKVIDFGVAKATGQPLTDKTVYTRFLQLVGSPLYMSPEQAGLSGLDVDTRADIYALGVLLYELLTGTTPFDRERFRTAAYDEVRRIIREEEPPRPSTRLSTLGPAAVTVSANRGSEPRKLSILVRGELDWIVMKCLEKDRNRRYEAAAALAADVRRFLGNEPVQACPPSPWYRFRKLARRNRPALVTASVLALAALGGAGALAVSTVLVWRANEELKSSVERERLEAYFQRITVAHRELSIDNLAAALRALHECPQDLRGWEWHYLMRLCKVDPLVLRDGPVGNPDRPEVNGGAFSPDGERLAAAGGDGQVRVWDSRTGRLLQQFRPHTNSVVGVTFHRDGRHITSVGADGRVKVCDWTTGREVFDEPCDVRRKFGTAGTAAFSPDGERLAAGSAGVVKVWDWRNRQVLYALPAGGEGNAISVAFSRDGGRLASASTGQNVKVWDLNDRGQLVRTFPGHPHPVGALAFSPDGGRLAEASLGRCVNVWDTATGELRHTLVHTGNVLAVAYSPDGRRLASAGEDKTVRVWESATGREVLGLRGHTGMCEWVAFGPDPGGGRLASASKDGTIRVWDATPLQGDEGQEVFTFPHGDEIRSVVVGPDGRTIAAAGLGPLVKTWDAATGEAGGGFDARAKTVFGLAWQPPDARRIATAAWDGEVHAVHVRDVRSGESDFALSGPAYAVAFNPDGRYLVTATGTGTIRVWDARAGESVGTLGTHNRDIRGLAFSADGRHLASASDGEVKLWDVTRLDKEYLDGKPNPRVPPLRARVPGPSLNVAFSPDGRWLVTGGEDNTIKVWDVETGRLMWTLPGHTGDVYAVAVSPDGRWVASGGEDSTVKVWDARNEYRLARSFRGHTGLVASLAFASTPGGLRLISGSRDHTVKVWDVTPLSTLPDR
ncbi:MAG TPA: protein kinase [Gemmataceae bacterium]|nr:protein kinase [Gemmataceae bacterium]